MPAGTLRSFARPASWAAALVGVAFLATPAHALYLFFMRKDLERALAKDPASVVGKQVVFTDELVVMWPEAVERPANEGGKQWVLFDTRTFRCAIPRDALGDWLDPAWQNAKEGFSGILKQLEAINDDRLGAGGKISESEAETKRKELYWDLYKTWANRPLVTVFGTVQQADFWGPVIGKEEGVGTEQYTIVADKVERPRQRWYEDGLDEGLDEETPSEREILDRDSRR